MMKTAEQKSADQNADRKSADLKIDRSTSSSDHLVYDFKPSLFGAPWRFRLLPGALEWRAGGRVGQASYADVRRMRLSFRPVSMQTYRFVAEIWPRRGAKLRIVSSSWRSMVEQERRDAAYRAFVSELGRRIVDAQPAMSVETGSPPLVYWLGVAVVTVMALGLAALTVRALQIGAWSGAAFIAGFLALLLWQASTFMRRNRPGRCRPDALSVEVLPQ